MIYKNILVTGGAGFIGSHIVDRLIKQGYKVRILDNLDKQVHFGKTPPYLDKKAEFVKGSVTKISDLKKALENIDAIYHEAAVVGVGQSMYEIARYVYQNSFGTAQLLNYLANNKHSVTRLIVASSMSGYGEGLTECKKCGKMRPPLREDAQMAKKSWELFCPQCKSLLTPIPTPETESFSCNSIYAVTKQSQEDMCLVFGKAYGIATTAFRYFNVYGPRQSLSNPYTGVAAIFMSRLKNNHAPVIYEDGKQSRDFISVYDIVDANIAVLENQKAWNQIFNLGTGKATSIKEVANLLSQLLKKNISPQITEQFRPGDVRYCYADVSRIKKTIGWQPKWTFEQGMKDLISWAEKENAKDLFEKAARKLAAKGLIKA